jgi:hypothetical protein
MKQNVDTRFRSSDDVLRELVALRRQEVEHLQRLQASRLKEQETRGQAQLKSALSGLSKEQVQLIEKAQGRSDDLMKSAKAEIDEIRKKLIESEPSVQSLNEYPGSGRLREPVAAFAGYVYPYYATLHGSDGTVYWQGYNPGAFDVSAWASGSGSGLFGTGAGSFTVYLDWWFSFRPDVSRNYSQEIYVPFNGFYIVRSDDGIFTSKEAEVNINLSGQGYQYNWKPRETTNVLHVRDDNINVNERFDGWRKHYYSSELGADAAYLLVTAEFYVYARGGGSYAELNFADGNANKIGVPFVYVS